MKDTVVSTEAAKINPDHYNRFKNHQPKDAIKEWGLDFFLGNVVKYVVRAGSKPGESALTDLKKARQYLDFEIEAYEQPADPEPLGDLSKYYVAGRAAQQEDNWEDHLPTKDDAFWLVYGRIFGYRYDSTGALYDGNGYDPIAKNLLERNIEAMEAIPGYPNVQVYDYGTCYVIEIREGLKGVRIIEEPYRA